MGDSRPAADGAGGSASHDDHDPELIASLLDRDLSAADRAVAEARVAACATCATLEIDLRILTTATIELPMPARSQDYALTPVMAAALSGGTAREPVRAGARLAGEMRDSRSTHATHDRLLIANLVDRSVADAERARGEEQAAACRDCAILYDDLVALSAATHALPVPLRRRDFTLTFEDAERLRVRGWRRVLAAIGSSRDAFSRPLALGLTTLGLAGLMVASIPSVITGGAASSPTSLEAGNDLARNAAEVAAPEASLSQLEAAPPGPTEGAPAAAAGPAEDPSLTSAAPLVPDAMPLPSGEAVGGVTEDPAGTLYGNTGPVAGEAGDGLGDEFLKSQAADTPTMNVALIAVAGLLLLIGLGLFGLRWAARRVGED